MVRLVLFDIDGTLIRTGGAGVKAFAQVFKSEFNAVEHFELLKFAGRTDLSLVREFFNYHHIEATPAHFKRFFDRYVFWLDHMLAHSHGEICPGVLNFIHGLKSLPQPPVLGLLTGNIRLGAEIKLRHFGLWEYFETGAFADDHEDRNCLAAVARDRGCALLKQQLRPEQVLVIGDTPLDIRCARHIGARVVAVATGGASLSELEQHAPEFAVQSLEALDPGEIIARQQFDGKPAQ